MAVTQFNPRKWLKIKIGFPAPLEIVVSFSFTCVIIIYHLYVVYKKTKHKVAFYPEILGCKLHVFSTLLKHEGSFSKPVTFLAARFYQSYQLYGLINTKSLRTQCIRALVVLKFIITITLQRLHKKINP